MTLLASLNSAADTDTDTANGECYSIHKRNGTGRPRKKRQRLATEGKAQSETGTRIKTGRARCRYDGNPRQLSSHAPTPS